MADGSSLCFELKKSTFSSVYPDEVVSSVAFLKEEHSFVAFITRKHKLFVRQVNSGASCTVSGIKSFTWLQGSGSPGIAFIDTDNNIKISTISERHGSQVEVVDNFIYESEMIKDILRSNDIELASHFEILNHIRGTDPDVITLTCLSGGDGFRIHLSNNATSPRAEKIFNIGTPVRYHLIKPKCQHLLILQPDGTLCVLDVLKGSMVWYYDLKLLDDIKRKHSISSKNAQFMAADSSLSQVVLLYDEGVLVTIPIRKSLPNKKTEKRPRRKALTGFRSSSKESELPPIDISGVDIFTKESRRPILQLVCSANKVYVTCSKGEEVIFYTFDTENGNISSCSLPYPGLVVFHHEQALSPILLSDKAVYGICSGLKREHIVYKLMIYESATVADHLCHINQWDRCSIPLHALEIGLKHRQLDTVSFYLKSRENDFVIDLERTESGNVKEVELDQLQASFSLLYKSVIENLKDRQSKSFAEQLLQITNQYLHKVAKSIVAQLQENKSSKTCETIDRRLCDILKKVTDYIGELHLLIVSKVTRAASFAKRRVSGQDEVDNATTSEPSNVMHWQSMTDKEAICDGIARGCIPELQAFLYKRSGPEAANLNSIINTGMQRALEYLQSHETPAAETIFQNLGYDSNYKLRQLCMFTPDRSLRDFLIQELQRRGLLSEEEVSMVTFLHDVEQLYSCPSFELAKELRSENAENAKEAFEDKLNLRDCINEDPDSPPFDIGQHCGDIAGPDIVNSETAHYSHNLLHWMKHYTEEHKVGILLDQLFRRKDLAKRDTFCKEITWKYLCSYLDTTNLLRWICSQYKSPGEDTDQRWPFNQSITDSMLDHAYDNLPNHIRSNLLDELARRGVFVRKEYSDLSLLVRRLSSIHSLIKDPHPLTFRPETHGVSLVCLHQYIIQRCIDQKLPEVLFYYITFWGFGVGEMDLGEVGMAQAELPHWVDMMLHFRQTALQPDDLHRVYKASLSTEAFLEGEYGTVMDMVDRGLIGRSISTLMYAPDQLQQFIDSDRRHVLKDTIPRLHNALFEPQTCTQTQDINVYQLLQGNCAFDLVNLFGWQNTNTFAIGDNTCELPHFSHEELVSRHAHVEELDYTYYLKHGRPSFAFCALIMSQFRTSAKSLSIKTVQEACAKAYTMALQNFTCTHMVAACMAFIEMLGEDSTPQKLHCQVANQIYSYNNHLLLISSDSTDNSSERIEKEIYEMVHKCLYSGKISTAQDILTLLEDSTDWEISKRRLSKTSFEAAQWWLLPVVFCKHHGLDLTSTFLIECAMADDWVMFLTFAQMIQAPKTTLQKTIVHFKRRPLREHLAYIVNASTDEEKNLEENDSDMTGSSVMDVLIRCSKSKNPWKSLCDLSIPTRNPLMAVLASNYKDCDIMTCLCSWLLASIPMDTKSNILTTISEGDAELVWDTKLFSSFTSELIKENCAEYLLEGFTIFQPLCPIISGLKFCLRASQGSDNDSWKGPANEFKTEFYKVRGKPETFGFVSIEWMEETILQYIKNFLRTCNYNAQIGEFLRALDFTNITRVFSDHGLNVTRMHQVQLIVRDLGIYFDYETLGNEKHPRYKEECFRIAGELQTKNHFHQSRLFAEVMQIRELDVTVQQLINEQKTLLTSDVWKQPSTRKSFWEKCQSSFKKYRVNNSVAMDFFQGQLVECANNEETGFMYQLLYGWLPQEDEKREEIFVKIWKCRIAAFLENGEVDSKQTSSAKILDKDAILAWKPISKETSSTISLTEHEKKALDFLVGDLLNTGQIQQATDVGRHFGHFSKDLTIITTCLNLIYGMPIENMSAHVKKLLAGPIGPRRRNTSTASLVSLPGARSVMRSVNTLAILQVNSENDDDEEFEKVQSLLSTLDSLSELCVHSHQCAQFIVNAFRISSTLNRSFEWVVEQNSFQLLQHVICCDNISKFSLVRTYIESCGLTDDHVSGFISDVIVEALQVNVGIKQPGSSGGKSLVLRFKQPAEGGNGFNELTELIQVCDNQTLLGQRLLDTVISLASSRQEISSKMLIMEVELLISAHDCFTVGCNMEGISSVLRMARIVTERLTVAEEFSLMIRLLTRMGRYSEMTYVFDILRENHQFELLFNKRIDKNHALRSAILDYLKVYHPSDTDMHTMVSLHFTLYREIANILEEAAKKQLTIFAEMNTENSKSNQEILKGALQYFSDAGDAYVKENCISHAQTCVKMARLIALQLQLLPAKVKVIGLDHEGIKSFLRSHKKLYEAFILCDAYGVHSYWSEALYDHVIKGGDTKYLSDFRTHVTITDNLLSETAQRFLNEKLQNNRTACKNMKLVLQLCRDIQTKLKLANSMGFTDVVKELLTGDSAYYLKDTNPQMNI